MPLETLDRTPWSLSTALAHVDRIAMAEQALSWQRALSSMDAPVRLEVSDLSAGMIRTARREARDGLLIALRDGYLRATGRRSTTPVIFPSSSVEGRWRLHATDPGLITTAEWREGEFSFTRFSLTGPTWEYIDIEVPRFMVKAIWPVLVPEVSAAPADASAAPYTTPYLDLMQAAIAEFNLTTGRQEKKDSLVAWFLEHEIEGEPLSQKLADAMATLIRQPAAQRGGGKRVIGPDLRRVG